MARLDIPLLRKMLYNAARSNLAAQYRNDPSAVRARRDQVCWDMFGKLYDEMTTLELQQAIDLLNQTARGVYATAMQLATLRFYAVACALEYCNFRNIQFTDQETGEIYEGEAARYIVKQLYDKYLREGNYALIPRNIFTRLHTDWINPKVHQFLMEGSFRKSARNLQQFYYEKLYSNEADYLIRRFMQIHSKLKVRTAPGVEADFSNN